MYMPYHLHTEYPIDIHPIHIHSRTFPECDVKLKTWIEFGRANPLHLQPAKCRRRFSIFRSRLYSLTLSSDRARSMRSRWAARDLRSMQMHRV